MIEDFSIQILKETIESEEYKEEISELSSYAANVKQEGEMVSILAKILDKKGYHVALEYDKTDKHDLLLNDKILEAKFYYEEDIQYRLKGELEKVNNSIDKLLKELKDTLDQGKYPSGWNLSLNILRDIYYKKPHFFMLTILSRDLTNVTEQELDTIMWKSSKCPKYNKKFGYNNQNVLKIAIDFLNSIKEKKSFSYQYVKIDTNTKFPSSYHIHLYGFS